MTLIQYIFIILQEVPISHNYSSSVYNIPISDEKLVLIYIMFIIKQISQKFEKKNK